MSSKSKTLTTARGAAEDDGQFLICALRGHYGELEREAAGDALTTAQCFPEPDEHDMKAVADLTVQTLEQWEIADTAPARFEKSASEIDVGDRLLVNEEGFQEVLFKAWADADWGDNGEPTPAVLVWIGSTNLTAPLRLPAHSTVEIQPMTTGDLAVACERISHQARSSWRTDEEEAAMFDAMTAQVAEREACDIEVGDMLRCYDGVGEWFEEVIFTALSDESAEATEVLMWTVRSKTTDPIRMHILATAWVFSPGRRRPTAPASGDA